jgi:GDP/UDP-N,N'-diacetylbacillosamine 2-epimerase (hydrolysing)
MIRALEAERRNPLFRVFRNIPHKMFLALERDAALWIGNSSAALIESASWKTPVVNIGERQKGRLRGRNVIDVPCERTRIAEGIRKSLHDKAYRRALQTMRNPWGDGRTGERVRAILEGLTIDEKLLGKQIVY